MLGMGDVLSLIEKAEQAMDEGEAEKLEEKLRKNQFTLDDFRKQLKTIKRMGPLESVLGMIPGMGSMKQLAQNKPDEKQLGRVEAIISSMTAAERRERVDHQRQPAQADRRRQRHVGRRREPPAEAVHRDEAGAQDDRAGRHAVARRAYAALPQMPQLAGEAAGRARRPGRSGRRAGRGG